MSKLDSGQIARFWSKVNKGLRPDDCWIWTAGKSNGYGIFRVGDNKTISAHRYSYILHNGKEPGSLFVCHRCDNPSCVNPDHLFLGTQGDNIQDMIDKGRFRHAVGEKIGHALDRIAARLSDDEGVAADLKELGAALDRYYEETFEYQFDLDVIASALGMEDAQGTRRRAIVEHIRSIFPPPTPAPTAPPVHTAAPAPRPGRSASPARPHPARETPRLAAARLPSTPLARRATPSSSGGATQQQPRPSVFHSESSLYMCSKMT